MSTTDAKPQVAVGLAGVTVDDTEICTVNQTQLLYRGYEIADLAEHARNRIIRPLASYTGPGLRTW